MNEKYKMIEEILKEENDRVCSSIDKNFCVNRTCKQCLIERVAERLSAKYQPKLPEGSVVLSKEEYAEYVELRNSEVGKLVKENRELGKHCLDWMKLYHKQLTKTEQSRKETAKEILQELYEESISNISETVDLTTFQIKQKAKQFGVEVEE